MKDEAGLIVGCLTWVVLSCATGVVAIVGLWGKWPGLFYWGLGGYIAVVVAFAVSAAWNMWGRPPKGGKE